MLHESAAQRGVDSAGNCIFGRMRTVKCKAFESEYALVARCLAGNIGVLRRRALPCRPYPVAGQSVSQAALKEWVHAETYTHS